MKKNRNVEPNFRPMHLTFETRNPS